MMKTNEENIKRYIRLWMFNKYIMQDQQVSQKLIVLSEQVQQEMKEITQSAA